MLANFVAKFTYEISLEPEITSPKVETPGKQEQEEDLARWKLFVDGSSNQHACGVGLVLQTLLGEHME